MYDMLFQLVLFAAKSLIILFIVLLILVAFFALLSRGKMKATKGRLQIKNLNTKYHEQTELVYSETLGKKEFKEYLKQEKKNEKAKSKTQASTPNVFVLNFN